VENNEFTSQMAQFSSLEQLMGINSNLGMMTSAVNSANTSQAINLIGKEVTAVGHNIHVKNGVGSDVAFDLPDSATDVKIVIEDASGNVVKTISRAAMPAGANQVAWDPTTDSGAKLPDGIYTYSVIANDAGGNLMDVSTYSRGVASGVSFEEGVAWVHVGEQRYMLSEIMEVRAVKAA
jgi:flagellar basal-body rod modification protein FlgD